MKKTLLFFLLACLFSIGLEAQDVTLLNNIRTTNGKIKSFEADLDNTLVKPQKTTSQEGKLYFVSPKEFSAEFTTGKYMTVNEKKIKMNIGLFDGTFRIREGGTMQSLGNIFLYGFQGRIQNLADENNYSLATTSKDGYHIITATNNKKSLLGIGYKQVVFKYHCDSLLLKEIVLYDFSGNQDTYTISNVKYDIPVDQSRFDI